MLKNNTLRVIAGRFKGAKFQSPGDIKTHPMGNREKLALFNMLQPYLDGAKVLDAYAGSGALGIEALSRGAQEVIFIDRSHEVCNLIGKNLETIAARAEQPLQTSVHCGDLSQPEVLRNYVDFFNLIFADPPYDHFSVEQVENLIRLLQKNGILALSYPAKIPVPEFDGLTLLKNRVYAAAGIAIYQKNS